MSKPLTQIEIVNRLINEKNYPRTLVYDVLTDFQDLLFQELVESGSFHFRPIGTFTVTSRKGRLSIHPQTQAPMNIPSRKAVQFQISDTLKTAINAPAVDIPD